MSLKNVQYTIVTLIAPFRTSHEVFLQERGRTFRSGPLRALYGLYTFSWDHWISNIESALTLNR